jgi:hypothetical protein
MVAAQGGKGSSISRLCAAPGEARSAARARATTQRARRGGAAAVVPITPEAARMLRMWDALHSCAARLVAAAHFLNAACVLSSSCWSSSVSIMALQLVQCFVS